MATLENIETIHGINYCKVRKSTNDVKECKVILLANQDMCPMELSVSIEIKDISNMWGVNPEGIVGHSF